MDALMRKWQSFMENIENNRKIVLKTRQNLINHVKNNPEVNKTIYLDKPKGSAKKFGGKTPHELPFDYGEWPDLVNPSDNLGWDLILVPSSAKGDEGLTPVGHVPYRADRASNLGNDKIILASNSSYSKEDKAIIDDFFSNLPQFDDVTWY